MTGHFFMAGVKMRRLFLTRFLNKSRAVDMASLCRSILCPSALVRRTHFYNRIHAFYGRTLSGIVRIQNKLYTPSMQPALSLILYKVLHIKYLCQLSSRVFGTFYISSPGHLAVKGLSACCPLLFFSLRRLSFCTFTNCIMSHN